MVFRLLRGLPLVVSRWGESRTAVAPDFPFFQLAAQRHFFLGGIRRNRGALHIGISPDMQSLFWGKTSVRLYEVGDAMRRFKNIQIQKGSFASEFEADVAL